MKRLRACGKGSTIKRPEPITLDEENSLWEQKLLGEHSPKALVDTMVQGFIQPKIFGGEA